MSSLRQLALVLLFISLIACSPRQTTNLVGLKAPNTRIQVLDGPYLPLEDYRGKTVVLVFWAQWCAKSNQLLQELNSFAAGRSNNNVFLLVSVDKAEDLEKLRFRLGPLSGSNFTYGFSGNAEYDEAYQGFRCQEVPQVFVINPSGIVIGEGEGMDVIRKLIK